jgi:PTH1 family peptidyl-tRNA hydrolase
MWLVVGLGNPGEEYAKTRHNVGFMLIDLIQKTFPVSPFQQNQWSYLRQANIKNTNVLLVQPQTYMNRSGLAVEEVLQQYDETPDHLIVIYDDLDLEPGRLRIRPRGGHGGHRGIKSIIEHLGTNQFVRMRIGIGRPQFDATQQEPSSRQHVVDYVLQPFQQDEQLIITEVMTRSVSAIEYIVSEQIQIAMNLYNRNEFQEISS